VAAERATRGRLELRRVEKRFGSEPALARPDGESAAGELGEPALRRLDLSVEPGEFVVVVGPSGCGKTTLLNLVGGMLRPDRGELLLDGAPIGGPGPDRAIVFQDHGLFPWLSAAENIEFGLRMQGLGRRDRRERVRRALVTVHLEGSGDKLVHELSGGMRQRVAIARALVLEPAVLLMDEPFAALDAQTRTLLHAQLEELWYAAPKTVLFVTHSVGEAVRLADRVVVLSAAPGQVKRELPVALPRPRNFDDPELTRIVGLVRAEIKEEVERVRRKVTAELEPEAAPLLADDHHGLGGSL